MEREYIRKFDTMNPEKGYNFESGGHKNKHMSEASKLKMSIAKKGKYVGEKNPMYGIHLKHSEEWKKKLSEKNSGKGNPMYGVHLKATEEQRRKESERFSGKNNPFYGRKHSEETKKRIRDNRKDKKAVICIETGITYESIQEAERKTGIINTSIGKCCNGKQKVAGNYHWKFVA